MHRVLIVCDRPSWAYDTIAKALIKHNHDPSLDFGVAYIKGAGVPLETIHRDYDLVFVMGWQLLGELRRGRLAQLLPFVNAKIAERFSFLDPKRTLTGIHSHHAWDNRQTQPDNNVLPPQHLIEFLQWYCGVNAVSRRLYDLFRQAGLTSVVYTPNGADIELFKPEAAINLDGPLRVGFSGNKTHDWRKGITDFIEPACDIPGVESRLAMLRSGQYVPLEEMPRFYNEIDVYLCASSSEGFSLSVLEASACGRPVISTRVGGCEDLIIDGVNGFLVDRDVQAIREKIEFFLANRDAAREMGAQNRRIVEELWSWAKRTPAWIEFIKAHLPG
jgi:glycosyltransferase involved in cell wall biosynthesis